MRIQCALQASLANAGRRPRRQIGVVQLQQQVHANTHTHTHCRQPTSVRALPACLPASCRAPVPCAWAGQLPRRAHGRRRATTPKAVELRAERRTCERASSLSSRSRASNLAAANGATCCPPNHSKASSMLSVLANNRQQRHLLPGLKSSPRTVELCLGGPQDGWAKWDLISKSIVFGGDESDANCEIVNCFPGGSWLLAARRSCLLLLLEQSNQTNARPVVRMAAMSHSSQSSGSSEHLLPSSAAPPTSCSNSTGSRQTNSAAEGEWRRCRRKLEWRCFECLRCNLCPAGRDKLTTTSAKVRRKIRHWRHTFTGRCLCVCVCV